MERNENAYDLVRIAKGLMDAGNFEGLKAAAQTDRNLYRLLPTIEKATVSSDALSDMGIAFDQTESFLRTLDTSAIDVMRTRPAPVNVPLLNLSTATAGVIAEYARLPVITSAERFSMAYVKTGGISVMTREQLRTGIQAESMLSMAMKNGISSCSNRALVETLVADAGTTTTAATGTTVAHILDDISAASDSFEFDANTILYVLASTQVTKNLSLKNTTGLLGFPGVGVRGGELQPQIQVISCPGWPVVDSNNAAFAMVVDAGGLLVDKGQLYVSTSDDATLQMIDPDGGATTKGVSLFQEDLVSLRYTRTFAVHALRPCVAVISGIAW